MSFHVSFVARSIADARAKLAEQSVPTTVKAIIEKALDAIPEPKPDALRSAAESYKSLVAGAAGQGAAATTASSTPRYAKGFFGVSVEATGHIADTGDSYPYTTITKLDVHPLIA